MNVCKWRDGRLVECSKLEALFSFWVSCVPGAFEKFIEEHGAKTEYDQIAVIAEMNKANLNSVASNKGGRGG